MRNCALLECIFIFKSSAHKHFVTIILRIRHNATYLVQVGRDFLLKHVFVGVYRTALFCGILVS